MSPLKGVRLLASPAVPRPLPIRPAEQAPGYEQVDRFAGTPPQSRRPGGAGQNVTLPHGELLRAVAALVFQEMAKVLAGHHAKPSAAATMHAGQLEIDQGGLAVEAYQQIGFFGQVVVGHPAPVQLP